MRSLTLDDFNMKNVIGSGSFGKVFLMEKKDSGEVFAVKTVAKQVVIDHTVVNGFLKEQ